MGKTVRIEPERVQSHNGRKEGPEPPPHFSHVFYEFSRGPHVFGSSRTHFGTREVYEQNIVGERWDQEV